MRIAVGFGLAGTEIVRVQTSNSGRFAMDFDRVTRVTATCEASHCPR